MAATSAGADKTLRLQAARIEEPELTRHIALAMSRHGQLTLACRAVIELIEEIEHRELLVFPQDEGHF